MRTKHTYLRAATAIVYGLTAIVSFHLAYTIEHCQILIALFAYCLFQLARVQTTRQAFYIGLAIGFAIYAPHLSFFWNLFGPAAIPLWLILSLWLALFVLMGRACVGRLGFFGWACLAPFLWTGLEYFRSELDYLRFSWLNIGYAFSNSAALHFLASYGVYGIGFVFMALAAAFSLSQQYGWPARIVAGAAVAMALLYPIIISRPATADGPRFRVTGVQLEFPGASQAILALDNAIKEHPDTDLFVLSEYTFMGPVPDLVKKWTRKHQKYIVAGGEDPISGSQYFNTVFVVDPSGKIVFQQAKCVPVQFLKDGLAATNQAVWNSPWGRLGFGICYDASYTRVTDELIRQGAEGLIFPTMDVKEWGLRQHKLHGRIAPMRAAEYEVPVFRLCSSGISQFASPTGLILDSAPFPGEGAILSGEMTLPASGRMPPDRLLARISVVLTALLAAWLSVDSLRQRRATPTNSTK